ncbi:DUF4184 family protein [Streptomyces sp. NPDC091278]|uniref:DUF4184 family protein n=1 Tax=Streptomyces sp. NPDC091278 TaxID=3155301 RepID=UPI00344F99FC
MPFTLSHPAAVLPLLRQPFVAPALVAGAMAPDVPYFLRAVGIHSDSAQDAYEPLLNATTTHSPGWGLAVDLLFTLCLMAAYRLLRRPVAALLPFRIGPTGPIPESGPRTPLRYGFWLLLSAFLGIASHLLWDSFTHADGFLVTHVAALRHPAVGGLTVARLLQYVSTAGGLLAIGAHLWRRRKPRPGKGTVARPRPGARWGVAVVLAGTALLGGAVQARADFPLYRYETVADLDRPIVRVFEDGSTDTSYPTRTVEAPWGRVAEGVLTGAAKTAGAAFAVALLVYSAGWHVRRSLRRNG